MMGEMLCTHRDNKLDRMKNDLVNTYTSIPGNVVASAATAPTPIASRSADVHPIFFSPLNRSLFGTFTNFLGHFNHGRNFSELTFPAYVCVYVFRTTRRFSNFTVSLLITCFRCDLIFSTRHFYHHLFSFSLRRGLFVQTVVAGSMF